MLGYVGYKNDLKDQKLNNLKFGISGLEKTFDKKLLGKDGWIKLETNSKGRIKKELKKICNSWRKYKNKSYRFHSRNGL